MILVGPPVEEGARPSRKASEGNGGGEGGETHSFFNSGGVNGFGAAPEPPLSLSESKSDFIVLMVISGGGGGSGGVGRSGGPPAEGGKLAG